MQLIIPSVIGPAQLQQVQSLYAQAEFVDGKISAGAVARTIKSNQELDQNSEVFQALRELVMGNLLRHPKFRNAVLPHKLSEPIFARYGVGMAYGDHIDDPIMGSPHHFRTDVSYTVFLNDPDSYQGGELVINSSLGEQTIKLPAGHVVLYPSGSRHRVTEVTAGNRLVMVGWAQSLVRDPARRELLFELNSVRERRLRKAPGDTDSQSLDHVYINLMRMWAEV